MYKIFSISTFIFFLLFSPLLSACAKSEGGIATRKVVILIHGFYRTKYSFLLFEKELEKEGYFVINETYPSDEKTIEENALFLKKRVDSILLGFPEGAELYFVTHSMGALVARCYINTYHPKDAIRMVMIAPPNRGAVKAEYFKDFPLYDKILGPSGIELASGSDYISNLCGGAPEIEFGIIAGGKGDNEGYSTIIPGDDDGTVGVWSTYIPGAKDFLLLDYYHTFIIDRREVIENAINFLNTGRFLLHTSPPQ